MTIINFIYKFVFSFRKKSYPIRSERRGTSLRASLFSNRGRVFLRLFILYSRVRAGWFRGGKTREIRFVVQWSEKRREEERRGEFRGKMKSEKIRWQLPDWPADLNLITASGPGFSRRAQACWQGNFSIYYKSHDKLRSCHRERIIEGYLCIHSATRTIGQRCIKPAGASLAIDTAGRIAYFM